MVMVAPSSGQPSHGLAIDIIEKWELSIRFVDIEAKSLMFFTNR